MADNDAVGAAPFEDIGLQVGIRPIVGGVPTKLIRERFPKEVGERMDKLAWWDWEHDRLRIALQDFRNLSAEDFLARYE